MSTTEPVTTLWPEWFYDANPPTAKIRKLIDQGRIEKATDEYRIQLAAAHMRISVGQFKATYGGPIEDDRRKNGEPVVYFIARAAAPADGDPIKIGVARDVSKRLRGLQTSSPETLHVLGTMEGGTYAEGLLHDRFDDLHIRGEWFRMAPELRKYIAMHRRKEDAL